MAKPGKILIVDDNRTILDSLEQLLKFDYREITTRTSPDGIIPELKRNDVDVILLDMNFTPGITTGEEGMIWTRKIMKYDPQAVIILITAYGDIELAVKAIKEGAIDFIVKPWDPEKLLATIRSAYELRQSRLEIRNLRGRHCLYTDEIGKQFDPIIGKSEAIKEVLRTAQKAAESDANILITGENGTGKELFAREIHNHSTRAGEDFIGVDVGSLTESLFESEMFGHKKGAFTDAKEDRIGRFEIASGGTLFLDEIGNLSVSLQSKLLRALEEKMIIPVGSNSPLNVDIRLICATNRNLQEMMKNHTFREDLYFRINTLQIIIPPLRSRTEDIPYLLDYFLDKFGHKYRKQHLQVNSEGLESLMIYHWPGNIREFKHTVEKAVLMNESGILTCEDFFGNTGFDSMKGAYAHLRLDDVERNTIRQALVNAGGNISRAAKILDISRTTLYSKMVKHGI
ncbi:MAG: AAA family ATPase [Bacteroides sp. SM23_62_1]|nr:MAG: AAA family ATPase [Bacteroides sp. SM23_62_1]